MGEYAFHITENGSTITVTVLGREFPHLQDYWDGNQLSVQVEILLPGYTANFGGTLLRTYELERFASELKQMYSTLKGKSTLQPLEGAISLQAEVNKAGFVFWAGKMIYPSGGVNVLKFELINDQTYLPDLIMELDAILEAFPIRGK